MSRDWFRRRTFHHARFADLHALNDLRESQDLTVSACIPALNEEHTVGPVVEGLRARMMDRVPLISEVVVMDSASEDDTVRVAEAAGAAVVQDRDVLPDLEPYTGKGEAMWKSLFVLKGDIIVWLDADIQNFHPRYVYGTLGPILTDPDVGYVKAFYDRPLRHGDELRPSEGGRVTELVARPLLNMWWPELAGLIQPLSGEYAGRRSVMEQVPFFTGYGVEIGLLVDILDRFGLEAIAQVDLETRLHRNRPIRELSRMAAAILRAAFLRLRSQGRLRLEEDPADTLLQFGKRGHEYEMEESRISVRERPPAATLPQYSDR